MNNKDKNSIGVINKSLEDSSFKALRTVKDALGQKKLGHMGTLDPLAAGCLPFAAGAFTTLIPYIQKIPKEYIVKIYFGVDSVSIDREFVDVEALDYQKQDLVLEDILVFLDSCLPAYEQVPPKFSAKKVEGKRAYKLARGEVDFELKPKRVDFFSYEVLSLQDPVLELKLSCGEGFYVRSLVRDLAMKLKKKAFMLELLRTKVGIFDIDGVESGEFKFYEIDEVFDGVNSFNLSEEEYSKLQFGVAPVIENLQDFNFAYYNDELKYFMVNKEKKIQKFLIS